MILIKKGTTIQTVFISLAIAIMFYLIIANFITENASQAGVEVNASYVNAATQLQADNENLSSFVNDFGEAGKSIREGNIYEFGVNGIKGTLTLMLLPFRLYDIAYNVLMSMVGLTFFVSPIILKTIELIIGMIIIGAAVAFLTSRGKEA